MLNIVFNCLNIIPILLNNSTIFQPAHSIRYFKTTQEAPILQLQIQQGTTQGQIMNQQNNCRLFKYCWSC
uniref:Uncharacterized protein n=2 Tax=Meloidogyne TaxID=189290 RepID=A0A6V7WSU4_MELEN|nr:unnamed protein product [Meloidogyne enterolobii]